MNAPKSIIIFLSILLSISCKNPNEYAIDEQLDSSYITMNRRDPLCGTWKKSVLFSESKLIIKQDSTFEFHNSGSLGVGYTSGTWIKKDGKLLLTSFDKFKKVDFYSDTSNLYFSHLPFSIIGNELIEANDDSTNTDLYIYKKIH